MLASILNIINCLLPKKERKISFCGVPIYDDMLRGFIHSLNKSDRFINYDLIILSPTKNQTIIKNRPLWVPSNLRVYYKWSILGIFHLFNSKRIYFTHGIFNGFKCLDKDRQFVINLWHGMPIKRIGRYLDSDFFIDFHKVLVSVKGYEEIIKTTFGVSDEKIVKSDLPRNMLIDLSPVNKIRQHLKLEKGKRIIFWLPTYQENITRPGTLFGFTENELRYIDDMLYRMNKILLIKPHPFEEQQVASEIEISYLRNIQIVIQADFMGEYSLYEFFGACEQIITDFSSVILDLLPVNLNRRIDLFVPNYESYMKNRGLIPDLEFFINSNQIDELIEFIDIIEERKEPTTIFNKFKRYKSFSIDDLEL